MPIFKLINQRVFEAHSSITDETLLILADDLIAAAGACALDSATDFDEIREAEIDRIYVQEGA